MALDLARSGRRPVWPRYYTAAAIILTVAILIGIIQGTSAGAPGPALVAALRPVLYLVVIPPLVANMPWDQWSPRSLYLYGLGGVTALVGIKALLGLAAWASSRNSILASAGDVGSSASITYYEPTAELVTLLFALCVLATLFARVRTRPWFAWTAVPALLCFVLASGGGSGSVPSWPLGTQSLSSC